LFRLLGAVSPPLAARLAVRLFTTPRARTLSPQESQFLQQAQNRRLAHAGGDIQVYEWAGAGPTAPGPPGACTDGSTHGSRRWRKRSVTSREQRHQTAHIAHVAAAPDGDAINVGGTASTPRR